MANQITALLKLLGDASGAVKAIKQVDDSLSGLQKAGAAMSSIGKSMTTYVTAPMIGMATVAGKVAVDFDKAMMGVNSVLKLSGQEFQTLKQDVLSFSTTTSQSSKDVAMSLRGIVSSGFEATDAMTILRTTVDAAGNMMTDTATTTRAMTSVLQAFGMEATEVTHIADVMETAANASALQFEELTSSIGNAVGTAAAAGVSFEDTAAAMMTISDAGYGAAEASTALRSLMTEMLKPSDELAKAIQSWGYETGEAALQAEGLEGIIQLLMQTTDGSAAEMAELLGNIRAQKAAFALARDEGQAFADSMREIGEASAGAGEHAKMAEIRHQSWAYQLAKLKSELEVLTIRLAEGFMPAVIDIVVAAKDFATTMAELPQPVLNTAVKVAALVAALGPLLMITGQVVTAIGTLSSVIGPLIGTIGTLGAASLSGTTALAVMGGGAGAAATGFGALAASIVAALGPIALVTAGVGAMVIAIRNMDFTARDAAAAQHDLAEASKILAGGSADSAEGFHDLSEAEQKALTVAYEHEQRVRRQEEAAEKYRQKLQSLVDAHKDVESAEKDAGEQAEFVARSFQEIVLESGKLNDSLDYGDSQLGIIKAKMKGVADAGRDAKEGFKAAAIGAKEAADAQAALQAKLDAVKFAISGPIKKANDEYIKQEQEILDTIDELTGQIEDYEAKQGTLVSSGEDLVVVQADLQEKTEKLSEAQQALAENTDPDKQLQLEAAVAKARSAVDGASGAVAAATPHYVSYAEKIGEANAKIDEQKSKLRELAGAHREHIGEIILQILEAKLAASGWSDEAIEVYSKTAEGLGLMSEADAKVWQEVGKIANSHADADEKVAAFKETVERTTKDALGPMATELLYGSEQSQALAGKLEEADSAMERAGGKADSLKGDINKLGGEMEVAAGQAGDLSDSVNNLPTHKRVEIEVHTKYTGGRGDVPEKIWEPQSPRFLFQVALENLVAFAKNNPVNIAVNAVGNAAETGFASIKDLMESLIDWLGELEKRHPKKGTVKAWGDALSALAEAVIGGLEALSTIADFEVPDLSAVDEFVELFRNLQVRMVAALGAGAEDIKEKYSKRAEAYWAAVAEMASTVAEGVDALASLVDYVGPSLAEIAAFVADFRVLQERLGQAFKESFAKASLADIEKAEAYWAALESFAAAVAPAVEALTSLAGYSRMGLAPAVKFAYDFRALQLAMAQAISESFAAVTPEDIAKAEAYWQAVESFVSILTPSLEALTTLATYAGVDADKIIRFAEDFKALQRAMAQAISSSFAVVTPEDIAKAEAYWGAIEAFADAIAPAVEALVSLAEYVGADLGRITRFAADFQHLQQEMADAFGESFAGMTLGDITKSEAYWQAIQSLVDVIMPAIEALTALVTYAGPPMAQIRSFAQDFADMIKEVLDALASTGRAGVSIDLSEWTDDLSEQIQNFSDAAGSVFQALGEALGFLLNLGAASVVDLQAGIDALDTYLDTIAEKMQVVVEKMIDLAEDVLTDWEEGASLMADKATAAAGVAGEAFGALGSVVGLIEELGAAENLEAGLAAFEANIETLEAKMHDVVNRMIALANTILTDWEEGASQIADTANAASQVVSEAFGALDSVIGAISGLVDMMGEVALVAGTEYLEEEDWAGLAWVITRVFQVTRTALERIRDAVVGLDTSTILDAASLIGHVGEAVGALSEAFANINVRIPPTEGEIEGFLAALVDFYEALKSYVQHFREQLEDPFDGIDWYPYGSRLIQQLIAGIESGKDDLEATLTGIRNLFPSSPAKEGPLSKPVDWSFLSDGLPNALSSVNAMLATPRFGVGMPDLQGAFAGAAGTRSFNWTINNPTREPEDIARDIRRAELVDRYKR